MSEFIAINTQEEFDARISERLKRERDTVQRRYEEKYAGYVSREAHDEALQALNDQLAAATAEAQQQQALIDGLNQKVRGYESASVKARIANEMGLPYGMAERLNGEDEDAIRKDAESLKALLGQRQAGAPAAVSEPVQGADAQSAAFVSLLNRMRNKD